MILTEEIRLLCNELEGPLALSVTMLLALHSISSENTTHIPIELSMDEVCKSIPTAYCTNYLEQPSISSALHSQTFPFNRHQTGVTIYSSVSQMVFRRNRISQRENTITVQKL